MASTEEVTAAALALVAAKGAATQSGKALVEQFKGKMAFAKAGPLEQSIIDWEKAFDRILGMELTPDMRAELESAKLGTSILKSALTREAEVLMREVAVLGYATEALPPDAEVRPLDEDWKELFSGIVRTASSQEMLKLYGAILAGEAVNPGGFSKRAVSALRLFGPFELGVLEYLSGCSITAAGHQGFLFRPSVPSYREGTFVHDVFAIGYGLLPALGYEMNWTLGPKTFTRFRLSDGSNVEFVNESLSDLRIPFPGLTLTDIGADLCQVATVTPNKKMLAWLARPQAEPGYVIRTNNEELSELIKANALD